MMKRVIKLNLILKLSTNQRHTALRRKTGKGGLNLNRLGVELSFNWEFGNLSVKIPH